jgi:aminodeoxyfutalosine synthase
MIPDINLLPPSLRAIGTKVVQGERLQPGDALALYQCEDLASLGLLATWRREQINGNVATFIRNRYFNYSNLCVLSCQFCAFGARKRDAHAFELSIPEMVRRVEEALPEGITEVHMVGGLHPSLPAQWYLDLLSSIHRAAPRIHIKAFTAIEIRHLADRIFKKPLPETLSMLREAGLNSLTGGGAEIFDQGVRDRICRGKETAEEWKDVHRVWHQMGQRSTCTMLYGHVETLEQRVDHLAQLRSLQDETGGFTGFVPFAFVPETTILAHIPPAPPHEQLRNIAVSRLFLDNIPHITAYWVSLGAELARVSLEYGADDLQGTMVEENVLHMAGATTPAKMEAHTLAHMIRQAGYQPAQRDSHYDIIRLLPDDPENHFSYSGGHPVLAGAA